MIVLFFHLNGIDGNAGGVSRTTETLGMIFEDNGIDVWFVGAKNINKGKQYHPHQIFLPKEDCINNKENVDFLSQFIRQKENISIINQASLSNEAVSFIAEVKKHTGAGVISCLHNSVLTPVLYGAYQKEFLLRKKHLSFLFEIMRTPLVTNLMTNIYICKYRQFYQNILDKSDKVILLCNGQVDELRKMCGTIDDNKVSVIPNCQLPVQESEMNESKENLVLWVGTVDYSIKRPDNMLRIWNRIYQKHPDWKLTIVGDGSALNDVKSMAKAMGLKRVSFAGRKSPEEYYRKAKIVCVTSVHESFSLVTTEAQANGAVPVVFDSFTAASIVVRDGETGILVPPFKLDAFANEVSRLMNDNYRLNNMSEGAKKSVSQFSPDIIYKKWQEVL
jgi:glycosyltransferase involved in cell wall biosynthesis